MANHDLRTDNIIVTTLAPEFLEAKDFTTKKQSVDPDTGLNIWTIKARVRQIGKKGTVMATVKVASKNAPEVEDLGSYGVNGLFSVTDYLPEGSRNVNYVYNLVGTLTTTLPKDPDAAPAVATAPKAPFGKAE